MPIKPPLKSFQLRGEINVHADFAEREITELKYNSDTAWRLRAMSGRMEKRKLYSPPAIIDC
jgi:hypothetical protein